MTKAFAFVCITVGSVAWSLNPVLAGDDPTILREEKMTPGVLAYAPDGKRMVSGGNHLARSFLWDVATGSPIAELTECGDIVKSVSYSPDGKVFVTAGLDTGRTQWRIVIWNGLTGKRQSELPVNLGWRAEILPGGKSLAVAALSGRIAFFQLPKLQRTGDFETDEPGGVDIMAVSPDGKTISTVRGTTIHVWATNGGKMLAKLKADSPIKDVAFTRDSKGLCTGTEDGQITRWSLSDRRPVWTRKVHANPVTGLAISAKDGFMVSVGQDAKANVLNVGTGQEIRSLEVGVNDVTSVAISPEARSIAVGHFGGISIWKTDTTGDREAQN